MAADAGECAGLKGDAGQIDWLVLTAANEAQAMGYRAQLAVRAGRLGCKNCLVVPDPGDRRVGSGGSTFVVLFELAKRLLRERPDTRSFRELFEGQRILVIHSGGDSRRLPAYAAEGKVFAPVPRMGADGRPTTMFDLVLEDLAGTVLPGRVVIGAGDVLLGVSRHAPDLSHDGMVGVGFPGTLEQGSRHGVYVASHGQVKDFLQKPDEKTARSRGAVDRRGRVSIDTGIVSLDAATTEEWLRACGVRIVGGRVEMGKGIVADVVRGRLKPVDLYHAVLTAAGSRREFGKMIAAADGLDRSTLETIGNTARRIAFRVAVTPPCDFLHVGSTREMVKLVCGRGELAGNGKIAVYNSVVTGSLRATGRAIVESSRVDNAVRLDGGNMLVGFPGGAPLHLKKGWGLVCLPIGDRDWACVCFHESDDFKTAVFEEDGTAESRVAAKVLFDGPECSLWTARLWPVGRIDRVVKQALRVMTSRGMDQWPGREGKSLRELITMVNHERLLSQREGLTREAALGLMLSRLRKGKAEAVARLIEAIASKGAAGRAAEAIESGLRVARAPFVKARLFRAGAAVAERYPGVQAVVAGVDWRDLDLAAFACVADGVAGKLRLPAKPPRATVGIGRRVVVQSPVRIDLAGGWSDTPPICHEMGGDVVNMAITLDGRRPIEVTAEVIEERCVWLESLDLRKKVRLSDTVSTSEFNDPHDWAALPKAALALTGITPLAASRKLEEWLGRFGGGLKLTMSAAVPKGSGLGTSSILGAAILACLDRVCGVKASRGSLMERTSVLEQMMSTAGGWQDQAGGITPGIKLVSTEQGAHQVPRVRRIAMSRAAMDELKARSLLLYTGRRRLARDILHGVVRRYLNQDPAVIRIVEELKDAARTMARDLARGDIDGFARGVLRNWELKKAIDPGSTNAMVEAMLRPLVPRLSGYELAGAGGGGFIYMVAKSTREAAGLRRQLNRSASGGARLQVFDVDLEGMTVEVV